HDRDGRADLPVPAVSLGRGRASTSSTAPGSCDEVGVVDHACGVPAGDADEDALVQPVEVGGGRLDLGRGAEGVLAGVDMLTAPETGEDLGAAMAHTPRLDVEQIAAVCLQRVTDVAQCGAVRQDDLPVGAGA